MKDITITEIIRQSLTILENEVGLAKSSLAVVASRSFKPISDYFIEKQNAQYSETLIKELDNLYLKRFQTGEISQNVYNLRVRGTRILREVYESGTFRWKGPASKSSSNLPENFEHILAGVTERSLSEVYNRNIKSITKRFFQLINSLGINDITQIGAEHVQMFLRDISKTRSKSMDDVVGALRKLDRYLTSLEMPGLPYAGLLMAPRARERKIHPCMPQADIDLIIKSIDRSTAIGKRDYAILLLAVSSGMRAGDLAKSELSDIDWRKSEIIRVQSKTQVPVTLPLQKGVGSALADYILNGRPKSEARQIFLRSLAPFQGFKDGVSVACVLRRRMKAVGISRLPGDGKTMHGIRRMLATQMTIGGVPVTTTVQVLGQQDLGSAKPYISLDIEGLRKCALGFDCLKEGY